MSHGDPTFAIPDGATHYRRGAIPGSKMTGDAVAGHHFRRSGGESLGPEAGIVADYHSLPCKAFLF